MVSPIYHKAFKFCTTRQLKTVQSTMTPLPLHLSDIHCKCFLYRCCHGKQSTLLKGEMSERTNEGVYVACW